MAVGDLTGKRAIVTGAARGLGAGAAEALSRAGASVMIADILDDLGEKTAAALSADGSNVAYVHLDVTEESDWENAVSTTIAALGGFDILVNNAGIEISSLVADIDPLDVQAMFDVNVLGTLLGVKHAFRAMRPDGAAGSGGSVVNISSVAATISFPGIAGYSASKSAVDRLTRVAANEAGKLGYGVRVNCIYPGLVPNEMGSKLAADVVSMGLFPDVEAAVGGVIGLTPLGRLADPTDIADAVVFLASDASRFITGIGLPVDGGMGM